MKTGLLSKNDFLYCGLERDELKSIGKMIMERNISLVSKVAIGVAFLGVFFFTINALIGSQNLLAYLILMFGGTAVALTRPLAENNRISPSVYCYSLILVVFAYGIVLSFQPGNINNPATSIVVFFAIMPLIVNDKPIRMGILVFISTVLYLVCAYLLKSSSVFVTDIMNTLTFSVLGFFLYIGISNRNVKEIFYGIQAAENEKLKEEARVAELANKAKDNFLANMSHEIRTPLNGILGMDEMIIRDTRDSKIRKYALDIKSAGSTLLAIINDILDLSKIESGSFEIIPTDYDIASILNDVLNLTRPKALKKDLGYNFSISPDIPSELHGDEIRIRQVLLNIINNAVKYTEKGHIDIDVYAMPGETPDSIVLTARVADTGIGIKDEDKEKLFGSFQRLDEKKNRSIEGTGLGLHITRRLAIMMGGNIEFESEYGKGSTFTVYIPQSVVNPEPVGEFSAAVSDYISSIEVSGASLYAPQAHILAVDDNEMNLDVITGLLRDTHIRLDTACSGQECIEKAMVGSYDCILLDQMMPEMNGEMTLAEMRKAGILGNTPVVALTADAIVGAKESYISKGFSDYLSKPVKYEELEQLLRKYIPQEKQLPMPGNDALPTVLIWGDDPEKLRVEKERLEGIYSCVCVRSRKAMEKYLEKHTADAVMQVS